MEALWREACGALAQQRRPGTMKESDESTNVAAAVGFHPRPQQETRRSCDYASSSQKQTGRRCFLPLCSLTPFIVSRGEAERSALRRRASGREAVKCFHTNLSGTTQRAHSQADQQLFCQYSRYDQHSASLLHQVMFGFFSHSVSHTHTFAGFHAFLTCLDISHL